MTILVVCLDVAATPSVVELTVKRFIVAALGELFLPEYSDYLEKELLFHIQGWRSNGTVRNMVMKPRAEWSILEREGKHPPGSFPENDIGAIVRMLG